MYHSVNFGSKNSYEDWHLVPDGRPTIAIPSTKPNFMEIPGTSGTIDLSELLTGYPTYSNRSGELLFHVLNDYSANETWVDRQADIMNYVHGKRIRISLEDDPDYFYEGRVEVGSWTSNNDGTWSDISFNYSLDPYRYFYNSENSSDDGMMVYTGVNNFSTSFGSDVGTMPVTPEFIVTNIGGSGITITWSNPERGVTNSTKTITTNGTHIFYDLILTNISGSNNCSITITGTGTTKVIFRKGML